MILNTILKYQSFLLVGPIYSTSDNFLCIRISNVTYYPLELQTFCRGTPTCFPLSAWRVCNYVVFDKSRPHRRECSSGKYCDSLSRKTLKMSRVINVFTNKQLALICTMLFQVPSAEYSGFLHSFLSCVFC